MNPSTSNRPITNADSLMAAIASSRPIYSKLFMEGDRSIGSFVQSFSTVTLPAIQDRKDYIDEVAAQVKISQGAFLAERIRVRLKQNPVVFTANHLCLETMPLTVQSMVLGALGEDPGGALPVEASALIPADNVSYPVGLTLARRCDGKPFRIPILELSNKQRRQMTLLLAPFNQLDLSKALAKVKEHSEAGRIGVKERSTLEHILSEVLNTPTILQCPTFKAQAMAATPRLFDAWFSPEARKQVPSLAYSTFESIRTPLLIKDLLDPGTPVFQLFFDPVLREKTLLEMDGVPCCWVKGGRTGGSALLWEITPNQRTSPLWLEGDALVSGEGRRFPLEPSALVEALTRGELVPTSFLSLTLGLVRGLVQIGGFNQIDYLAAMQEGLSRAFQFAGYSEWAAKLANPIPPMLTAGISGILAAYPEGEWCSAGGVELMAHGGLSPSDLERIKGLSIREGMGLELPNIARMVLGGPETQKLADSDRSNHSGSPGNHLIFLNM